MADLDIDNRKMPFEFLGEPPPAPKITSEGIVAQDITEEFLSAASSMSSFHPVPPLPWLSVSPIS